MRHPRNFCARGQVAIAALTLICLSAPLHAATININGASFDAPGSCRLAEGALVCRDDGQQFELWVYRKPFVVPGVDQLAAAPLARRMTALAEFHESAVVNIMQSTGNDKSAAFSSYGKYVAVGSALPGKLDTSAPSVRFASILNGDEVWQFMEVVATRTPRIDALASSLQQSLTLPTPAGGAALGGASLVDITASAASFSGVLLSFQYPGFLEPVVVEDSATGFNVGFKHKSREAGPNVTISLRAGNDKPPAAATVVAQRKARSVAAMLPGSAAVEVKKLGAINGSGYALIGVPDAKKGFSGIESIETFFAADSDGKLLEIRLTAEQKYSADMEAVWALLVKSMKIGK